MSPLPPEFSNLAEYVVSLESGCTSPVQGDNKNRWLLFLLTYATSVKASNIYLCNTFHRQESQMQYKNVRKPHTQKKKEEEGKNTQCIKADPVQTYYPNSDLSKY